MEAETADLKKDQVGNQKDTIAKASSQENSAGQDVEGSIVSASEPSQDSGATTESLDAKMNSESKSEKDLMDDESMDTSSSHVDSEELTATTSPEICDKRKNKGSENETEVTPSLPLVSTANIPSSKKRNDGVVSTSGSSTKDTSVTSAASKEDSSVDCKDQDASNSPSSVPKDTSKDTNASKTTETSTSSSLKSSGVTPKVSSNPTTSKLPYLCSCGRNFDTRRGLSIHLAHEPDHRDIATGKKATSESTQPASSPAKEQPSKDSLSALNVPTTSPLHSPSSSTPNSPTFYMKTSSRNPQYYSIIRTRSDKRPRSGGSAGSPAKMMLLNNGEKVSVKEEDESETSSSFVAEVGNKRRSREEQKSKETPPGSHLRGHSLSSGSDNTSPTASARGSISSTLLEFGLSSSPITRSNAATLKVHEFMSLPSYKKRGGGKRKGRGGRKGGWKGGRGGGGAKHGNEDNTSEIGEDFESPGDSSKVADDDRAKESNKIDKIDSMDDVPSQPPKRKRGRPPKIRKDVTTPSTSPISGAAGLSKSKSSPSLSSNNPSLGPISSITRSSKSQNRGEGGAKTSDGNIKTEPAEENPLPSKSDNSKSKRLWNSPDSNSKGATQSSTSEKHSTDHPPTIPSILPKLYAKEDGGNADSSSQIASASVSTDLETPKIDVLDEDKQQSISTRSRPKRGHTDDTDSSGKKKFTKKNVSKTPVKNDNTVATDDVPESGVVEMTNDASELISEKQTQPGKEKNLPPPWKETRSKSRGKNLAVAKGKASSKTSKGVKKKSISESDGMESDGSVESNQSEVVVETRKGGGGKIVEDSAVPTAQIPVSQQRQSSVFVSVLSGPEKKGEPPVHQSEDQANSDSASSSSSREEKAVVGEKDPNTQKPTESQRRPSETSPVFPYSTSSTPFAQFPYPATFGPPPPHHIMYPPSGVPSTMYPHFYSYPGSQPMQMPPHPPPPGSYLSPTPPHPHPSMSATPPVPPNTTGDQNLPSPHNLHPQQPAFNSSQPYPPNSTHTSTTSGTVPANNNVSITATAIVTSVATTVGGVRVSVLDKPPTQLPMVTLPYHMPSATAPRPRPPGPGGYPMDLTPPGMRPYIGGAHSPDGLDSRPHIHPHPLSQVYRPGMVGAYHPTHLPPPHPSYHHPPLTVRLDAAGIPYMEWADPRPIPPEEHPVQPVECPECGRMFKNNKALNGHMRLHGGFDWTKKQPFASSAASDQGKSSASSSTGTTGTSTSNSSDTKNSEAKGKSATSKTTASSRKRSHSSSRSRSRSRSPTPGIAKSKPKRKKSSDETNQPSNLLKDSKNPPDKDTPSLPVQRPPTHPSIFTFDSNSAHAATHKPHLPPPPAPITTSSSSSTPSSEGHDARGTMVTQSGSTLEDLCRAAAELERLHTNEKTLPTSDQYQEDEFGRKRPGNITIPQNQSPSPVTAIDREKHRLGGTPPYTPPPILSPSRSIIHLAPGVSQVNTSAPCTPNRILQHWSSRRSTDGRKLSDTEDNSFSEPHINVGEDFQATLPKCDESRSGISKDDPRATLLWKPPEELTQEDESVIDGYLELACSPAVLYGGRNKELAVHFLHSLGGSIKEAVRWLMSGKTLFDSGSMMNDYNYSGANRWSGRERQQFRRAWKVHRKQFNMLRSAVESKKFSEIIEYYYTWKKYCSDEYRGRNRHISEEIFSDEDDLTYPQIPSSSSSGSGDSEAAHDIERKSAKSKKNHTALSNSANNQFPKMSEAMHMQNNRMYNTSLPIVYAPHSSPVPPNQQIHQFPCKYPGCNQIFTSIFALNGHIRVHGGSFFPKPQSGGSAFAQPSSISGPPSSSSQSNYSSRLPHSSSAHAGSQFAGSQKPHSSHAHKSLAELELARALLELPGHSAISSSKSVGYHTPSPKPSPGKSKALSGPKKKLSSSSPGEHEGYYPCNRCGRVFTKVKSRSAHMKSHVIKSS